MTATYEKIATTTLSSTASSVAFTSISGSYTDLVLVISAKTSSGPADLLMRVNGDDNNNYGQTNLYGTGSAAASSRLTNRSVFYCNLVAYPSNNNNSNHIVQLQNYSNTTTYKTFLSRANNAGVGTDAIVGTWRSTSAITSLTFFADATTFASSSIFTIYGIKAE